MSRSSQIAPLDSSPSQGLTSLLPPLPNELNLLIGGDLRDFTRYSPHIVKDHTLLVTVAKNSISFGPYFVHGQSVCFACMCHWIAAAGFDRPDCGAAGESEVRYAAALVAEAISEYERTARIEKLQTTIQTFDTESGKSSAHPIYPLSDCVHCAAIKTAAPQGLQIHCSSLTGIVQKMEITHKPAAGAYRAVASWASPLPVNGNRPLLARQESHGRGMTREQAALGCIGEALERYSLVYRGDETLVRARINEVCGIDPRAILLYSEQQYALREQWNDKADERYFVGERFDPQKAIDWFPAVNLTNGQPAFVPAACTLMWYSFVPCEPEFARADTVGCGSGWTFDDALLHALLEWIERDAMAIWWYNRIRRPAVEIDSFEMPALQEVSKGLGRIDRELILLDCTTDLGIPTYISIAARRDGTEPLFAGASHISPKIAAWKAASEVGQLWFTMAHKKCIDAEMSEWLSNSVETQPWVKPTHAVTAPAEPPTLTSGEQVTYIVDRLQRAGLASYAANLSRTDVLLKTARAIVPGLRHIWNRRAPGRLYDVPVKLGWRNSPLREDELNPICCMI